MLSEETSHDRLRTVGNGVSVRRFPPPFRAMLAVCSDIDTTTVAAFRELHRFLNTHGRTSMGRGVGLDIADSFWFYAPKQGDDAGQFSYFADLDGERRSQFADELLHYIREGWIDTLHSYGNFSIGPENSRTCTRSDAERALQILDEHSLGVPIWSNHGDVHNVQNIGTWPYMCGDLAGHGSYHADLLVAAGFQYVWDSDRAFEFDRENAIAEGVLRDGSRMWRFHRNYYASFDDAIVNGLRPALLGQLSRRNAYTVLWHPGMLHIQLAAARLDQLVKARGFAIVAQHLGFGRPMVRLGGPAVEAFRRLAGYQARGDILVARTHRLLAYNRAREYVRCRVRRLEDTTIIDIEAIDDPLLGSFTPTIDDLRGLTFYLEAGGSAQLRLGGRGIPPSLLRRYEHDGHAPAIGIAWFAADTRDLAGDFDGTTASVSLARSRLRRDPVATVLTLLDGIGRGQLSPNWRVAVVDARATYTRRFEIVRETIVSLGFERAHALDVGSGSGHWSIACALEGGRVVGIDIKPALTALSERIASAVGVRSRTSFVTCRAEQLPFRARRFELVWAHAVLAYVPDTEAAIREAARVLRDDGLLYCGSSAIGSRLSFLSRGLSAGDERSTHTGVANLVGERLYEIGLFGNRWSNLRTPTLDQLIALTDAYGLAFADQPAVQEGSGEIHGQPLGIDLLVRRDRTVPTAIERLRSAELNDEAAAEMQRLIESGAPQVVVGVLCGRSREIDTDARFRRILLRALLKAAPGNDPLIDELVGRERDPFLLGLHAYTRDDAAAAADLLASTETAEAAFVRGLALLEINRVAPARTVFRTLADDGASRVEGLVGLLAAERAQGTPKGLRAAFDALATAFESAG